MCEYSPLTAAKVKVFRPNGQGRDFAVGDVHGHFEHLRALLKAVAFSPKVDRVFSVGDLIDRGPSSDKVLDWLEMPWFHAVRGNHEQAAVDCASGRGDIAKHKRTGGSWLYELSFDVQSEIAEALNRLPFMIEVGLADGRKIGIVHAQAPTISELDGWEEAKYLISGKCGVTLQNAAVSLAVEARLKLKRSDHASVRGVDTLYVGHSTVPHIINLGNVTYIDTGCSFDDGALSLVELNTGRVTMVDMCGVITECAMDNVASSDKSGSY